MAKNKKLIKAFTMPKLTQKGAKYSFGACPLEERAQSLLGLRTYTFAFEY